MAEAATFELNPIEAARLDRAMVQSIAIEKRSAVETVKYLMIRIMQAGRSRTKAGKKYRDIVDNPKWTKGSNEKKFVVIRKLQPSGERLIPTDDRSKAKNPAALIKSRGLAKSSWGWGLYQLGKGGGTVTSQAKRHTTVKQMLSNVNPMIVLTIALDYIGKAFPGIAQQAMSSAVNYILKRQEQKLEKQLQRQFTK